MPSALGGLDNSPFICYNTYMSNYEANPILRTAETTMSSLDREIDHLTKDLPDARDLHPSGSLQRMWEHARQLRQWREFREDGSQEVPALTTFQLLEEYETAVWVSKGHRGNENANEAQATLRKMYDKLNASSTKAEAEFNNLAFHLAASRTLRRIGII